MINKKQLTALELKNMSNEDFKKLILPELNEKIDYRKILGNNDVLINLLYQQNQNMIMIGDDALAKDTGHYGTIKAIMTIDNSKVGYLMQQKEGGLRLISYNKLERISQTEQNAALAKALQKDFSLFLEYNPVGKPGRRGPGVE